MSPPLSKQNNQDEEPKSRTRAKKEDRSLQKIAEQLVALPASQLRKIGVSDEIMEGIMLARNTLSHGARKRQIKYVGSLLRQIDINPIAHLLENIRMMDQENAVAFKQLETWRESLKNGNNLLIEEILACCPSAQRQRLTQLAKNACREFTEKKGVSASRELFRYLKSVFLV